MFEFLKVALIKMIAIFMMSAKLATLGFLKKQITWNKGYDVIISIHEVTNEILSRDSNYVVDVVTWPKFGNSTIFRTEVIITSILQRFHQKNQFFFLGGVLLFQVQWFGTSTRYDLEILHKCGKQFETKSQKILGSNP